jgi:UDP-N-acetylmuramyl pentapeptide phosphotransferase/UDP-N-acetylglucosamine-1-phosphate transferase
VIVNRDSPIGQAPAPGVALGVMILISFLEDLRGVPAAWRLLAHLFAASMLAVYVLPGEHGIVAIAVTVIAIA